MNAIKSIMNSYTIGSIYVQRKAQTEKQYLELVKKKNELDYINSPFFIEKQLRESLNYYQQGEKLLVFTKPLVTPTPITYSETDEESAFSQWSDLLVNGVRSPLDK